MKRPEGTSRRGAEPLMIMSDKGRQMQTASIRTFHLQKGRLAYSSHKPPEGRAVQTSFGKYNVGEMVSFSDKLSHYNVHCHNEPQCISHINSSKIHLTVRNMSDSIVAEWNNPQPNTGDLCYSSHIQFKSLTDAEWEGLEVHGFSYTLPSPNWRKSYVFRVKMKYSCPPPGSWSQWTLEKWWGSASAASEAAHTDTSHSVLMPLILTPLIVFLLCCLFSQKRIKRKCISRVPDPKNMANRLLTIDESQLWGSLDNPCVDCMTADIEIFPPKVEDGGGLEEATCTQAPTLAQTAVPCESSCSASDSGQSPVHPAYVYL